MWFSLVAAQRFLTVVASVAECRLCDAQASVVVCMGLVFAVSGLWGTGSVAVCTGLSCSTLGKIFPQEVKPMSSALVGRDSLLSHQEALPLHSFNKH